MMPNLRFRLWREALPLLLLLGFCALPLTAQAGKSWIFFLNEKHSRTLDIQIDPYYSAIGYGDVVSNEEPTVLDAHAEESIYGHLLWHFFDPDSVRLEVSANPLPILGAYLKRNRGAFYRKAQVSDNFHLIQAMTLGFPDPGALSIFFGNKAYIGDYETGELTGVGYGGILLSFGNYHVVNNSLVADPWVEMETKVKGGSFAEDREINFSFRVGARAHLNQNIKHTVYVAVKRDRVDRDYFGWSPLKNSALEVRVDVNVEDYKPSRYLLLLGKKFPVRDSRLVFSLGLGVLRVAGSGYKGLLANTVAQESSWSILLRPNISF